MLLKSDYPAAIANYLGIAPYEGVAGPWMSNQGTVLKEWLLAVGEVLDVPYAAGKVETMRALVEAVGKTWDPSTMASTHTASGGGGNISRPAFEALFEGLRSQAAAQRRRALNQTEPPAPGGSDSLDALVLGAIRLRRGQPEFRSALLEAYGGRCAVTGCDAPAALEAAHIRAYSDGGTYAVSNGLLLRADVHTLFDLRLLSFEPGPRSRVAVHPELLTTVYGDLVGAPLGVPAEKDWRPSADALRAHRLECRF